MTTKTKPGPGRPPTGATVRYSLCLTPAQSEIVKQNGGAPWIRKLIMEGWVAQRLTKGFPAGFDAQSELNRLRKS